MARRRDSISCGVSLDENENCSVSVRKIDNGYIKTVSHSGPKGYEYKETFSETKPSMGKEKYVDTTK